MYKIILRTRLLVPIFGQWMCIRIHILLRWCTSSSLSLSTPLSTTLSMLPLAQLFSHPFLFHCLCRTNYKLYLKQKNNFKTKRNNEIQNKKEKTKKSEIQKYKKKFQKIPIYTTLSLFLSFFLYSPCSMPSISSLNFTGNRFK